MSRSRAVLILLAAALALLACRQDQPAGDPKMPANSPLPDIDRRDDDPAPAPGPRLPSFGRDAG